jgi:hypothetical protein
VKLPLGARATIDGRTSRCEQHGKCRAMPDGAWLAQFPTAESFPRCSYGVEGIGLPASAACHARWPVELNDPLAAL